jgi:hypothetical protein
MGERGRNEARQLDQQAAFARLAWILVLGVVLIIAALCFRHWRRESTQARPAAGDTNAFLRRLIAEVTAIETRENQVAETVWAKELLAEQCGQVFELLWDSLNATTDKFAVLSGFSFGELAPPALKPPESLPHGIQVQEPAGPAPPWTTAAWRQFLQHHQSAGWELAQLEFRHDRFEPDAAGQPGQSVFYFSAHLTNRRHPARAALEGDLVVDWGSELSAEGLPTVKRIDASHLTVKTRPGEPPFQQVFCEQIRPPEKSHFIDPLILYDLDGDGLSEIILAARNLVYRRRAWDRFEPAPLCQHSPGLILTGIIADFDGDGAADFLCAKFEGLVLFRGSPQGTFEQPGELVWSANPHLKYAQALTCGDIDGDGDLDLWLGQYKGPYERGQMPTPYYDANDGNPSYLLLNDGHGHFTDATQAAGLAQKRWRRSYSGSFVDLDGDGDLDLMVVSDFAGVDLYANDGHGHFTDLTRQWVPEPHVFGMAHVLADFDVDGRLDFLVNGMHCPTAHRLDHLGLTRPGHAEDDAMRACMTAGNRLYLGQPGGGFRQTPLSESVRRSGWSWGCSAADFDNDGFPDLYIASGHESKQSVKDYESQFWLHDIYVADSHDDLTRSAYFISRIGRTRGHGQSYGGYEKNRLYLNQGGARFVEVGHLLGVALEQDSRNVVTDDLDGDGRLDLLVTTFEVWPEVKQTLRVFRNTLEDTGDWIGFRFREAGHGASPVGAVVTLRFQSGSTLRQIVTGDSHRSQHADTVHFGLGRNGHVDEAEVRFANGRVRRLVQPAINRYHTEWPR